MVNLVILKSRMDVIFKFLEVENFRMRQFKTGFKLERERGENGLRERDWNRAWYGVQSYVAYMLTLTAVWQDEESSLLVCNIGSLLIMGMDQTNPNQDPRVDSCWPGLIRTDFPSHPLILLQFGAPDRATSPEFWTIDQASSNGEIFSDSLIFKEANPLHNNCCQFNAPAAFKNNLLQRIWRTIWAAIF